MYCHKLSSTVSTVIGSNRCQTPSELGSQILSRSLCWAISFTFHLHHPKGYVYILPCMFPCWGLWNMELFSAGCPLQPAMYRHVFSGLGAPSAQTCIPADKASISEPSPLHSGKETWARDTGRSTVHFCPIKRVRRRRLWFLIQFFETHFLWWVCDYSEERAILGLVIIQLDDFKLWSFWKSIALSLWHVMLRWKNRIKRWIKWQESPVRMRHLR